METQTINEILGEDIVQDINRVVRDSRQMKERAFRELRENNIIKETKDREEKTIEYTTREGDRLALYTYAFFNEIGYISWIWVSKPLRGHGIGTKLVKEILNDMEQKDIKQVYVLPKSDAATSIFNNFSFSQSSEINGWYVNCLSE